jgi:nucleotide-binding universal stress UspA family protein
MDTLIAATDFSKAALNASKFAAAIAAELGAKLLIVNVLELPLNPVPIPLNSVELDEVEKAAAERMEKLKAQLLFYTDNKIEVTTELGYGFLENVLDQYGEKFSPLAMVFGLSSNASKLPFIGSTTLRILPSFRFPVLVVPERAAFCGIHNIAIASGAEHIGESQTLDIIKVWLKKFNVAPDIIHVNNSKDSILESMAENVFLYNQLKEFTPGFCSITNENIEDGVFALMKEKKSDLLMVLPGKYSFLQKLFHASHTKKLILHSSLPVLAVPLKNAIVPMEVQSGSGFQTDILELDEKGIGLKNDFLVGNERLNP